MKTYSELEAAGIALRLDLLGFFAERVSDDGTESNFRHDHVKLRDPETDEFIYVHGLRKTDGCVFALALADLDGEVGDEVEPIKVSDFDIDEMFTLAGDLEEPPR